MNINANLMVTGHPKAIASKLCRYNAKPAEHVNHGRDDFLRQLADHHQNLGIEGRADSPIRELDENGEIIEDDDTKIDVSQAFVFHVRSWTKPINYAPLQIVFSNSKVSFSFFKFETFFPYFQIWFPI